MEGPSERLVQQRGVRPSSRRVEEVETKGRWEGRAGGGCGEPWRPRDVCEDGAVTCLGEALGVRLDVSRGQMPGFQWSLQMRYVSTHLPALSSRHTPAHGSDMSPPACSPALRRLRPPPVHSTPDWFLQALQGVSLLRSASLTPSPLPALLPRHRHRNRPFLGPSTCRELRTPQGGDHVFSISLFQVLRQCLAHNGHSALFLEHMNE